MVQRRFSLYHLSAIALMLSPALPATPQGDLGLHPGSGTSFFHEAHQGGSATELSLVEVFWGRLVEVRDAAGVLRFEELLIDPNIASDGVTFELDKNSITQAETLRILHAFDSREFRLALRKTQDGLVPLLDKGVGPGVVPPFTMVSRNAAFAVRFDDLLADGGGAGAAGWPGTVTPENLRLLTGVPAQIPFEARVLPDPSHGAYVGDKFHSTRALIGFTHSALQAQQAGAQVNPIGLPASISTSQSNAVLRVPSQVVPAAAQFGILTNLSGNGIGFSGNGSNDPSSPTLDVVRSFRSGGDSAVTGDPDNGFLPDAVLPELLAEQTVFVISVNPTEDGLTLDLQFPVDACAFAPRIGDLIETASHMFEVRADGPLPVGGASLDVRVRVLLGSGTPPPGTGTYTTTWDPNSGALPDCFVQIAPSPFSPPWTGVNVKADVLLLFSEPMQASSIDPFDSFSIRYDINPGGTNPLYDSVIGTIVPGADLSSFAFEPVVPLSNDAVGTPASYTIVTQGGPLGPVDLVGNPLANALPPVGFKVSQFGAAIKSRGLALRFDSTDEDGNGAPEIRGQFLYDFALGLLRPRPVTRFSAQADSVQHPSTAAMFSIPAPISTPLSSFGSKLMTTWRYHDLGLGLLDESTHNLDVEGLWWEPFGGTVAVNQFDEFQMSMAHSSRLPDEAISGGLLPLSPQSGLHSMFDSNLADAPVVVHPKSQGYTVSPLDLEVSPTGQTLAPWPMNRDIPVSQYVRFPWRDTASQVTGAPFGAGVDTQRLAQVSGPGTTKVGFYGPGEVPTIGLPLLMEFRTYPSVSSIGSNGFQVAIAINSSAAPYFRRYSSGGLAKGGQVVNVDPDQQTKSSGGFNPITGAPTPGGDNVFYYGQADFVVRVSRLHTIWFDALGASKFTVATVVPGISQQPAGTQVLLAYRGAYDLGSFRGSSWEDATNFDPYGNSYTADQHCDLLGLPAACAAGQQEFFPSFFPDTLDESWTNDINDLDGASYFQVRITMISNPETGEVPVVSALGLAFLE